MCKTIIRFFIFITCALVHAGEVQKYELGGTIYEYNKPSLKDPFIQIPHTTIEFFNRTFDKSNWKNLGLITASTLLLYKYDRQILDESQRLGRRLGIGNVDHTKPMITYHNFNIFRGPTDLGSSLYFLGDGWTHMTILSGFLISGAINENNRALQTGTQLFHGIMMNTFANQFLKHTTGRESPIDATSERGKWHFFPNQIDYGNHTSRYDAYPSGHVSTCMATFTIIRNNYPEYDSIIAPIQWTWISLLAFQMMNNGVHWASDYPLGIGIGYLIGQISSEMGRSKIENNISSKNTVYYLPILNQNGTPGIGMLFNF